jgi:Tfp pilus assembly protein PilN
MDKNEKIRISGHIKKHTIGTSNEISFSVLDAKKESPELNNDASSPKDLGKIHLFTINFKNQKGSSKSTGFKSREKEKYNKVGANKNRGALSDNAEVVERKRNRKRSKRILAAGITVCILMAVIGCMVFFINEVSHRNDYIGRLKENIEEVQTINNELNGLNLCIDASYSSDIATMDLSDYISDIDDVNKQVSDIKKKFNKLKKDTEQIRENLSSARDKDSANNLIDAIESRLTTIDTGEEILDKFQSYLSLYTKSNAVMNTILEADGYVREAASLAADASEGKINQSSEASSKALEVFNQAITALDVLLTDSKEFFGNDTTQYQSIENSVKQLNDYIDLRIESQNYAIEADKAYIERNSADIEKFNTLSNDLEIQAADLISEYENNLPSKVIESLVVEFRSNNQLYDSWQYELAKYASYMDSTEKYLG